MDCILRFYLNIIFPGHLLGRIQTVKLTSTITVAEIGKAPDIAEAYSIADGGHNEVQPAAPAISLDALHTASL